MTHRFDNSKRLLIGGLVVALLLGACASATPAGPTPTSPPGVPPPREVFFQTEDGITLRGTLFGEGAAVGVVLSHMRLADQTSWHDFARTLAENGYMALAYDFRGYGKSGGTKEYGKIDLDVQAAAKFLRSTGAVHIVLAGASMGGTASAKAAIPIGADALVAISSPKMFDQLEVVAADLSLPEMPSLWIASQGDPVAPDVQALYNMAREPKLIHIYEGVAHGTDLFNTADKDDLTRRLLNFLIATNPPDR